MKKKYLICFIFLLTIFAIVLAYRIYMSGEPSTYYKRVMETRVALNANREYIKKFMESKKRYPFSLKELKEFSQKNQFHPMQFKEYISDSEGCEKEVNEMNGTGGWYYNKETGELKINIAKPVKDILKPYPYSSQHRNEIPADW